MRLASFLLVGILALTVAASQVAALNNPFGRVGLPLTGQDFKEMAEPIAHS